MPKTMKQMKAIFKKYLQERVRVQSAAEAMVVAHQVALINEDFRRLVASQDHLAVLLRTHAASTSSSEDWQWLIANEYAQWLIANGYENEEREDGV